MKNANPSLKLVMRVTKALADSQRVRIMMLLEAGELCVCQIVEVLGLAPSTTSKHLSILEDANLIAGRKAGRWMYYRLTSGTAGAWVRPVRQWMQTALAEDPQVAQDLGKLRRVTACPPDELRKKQRKDLPGHPAT